MLVAFFSSSFIGRRGGRQVVSIGKNCDRVGIIIHELMHALGFWHEQSRPDRDEHITIHLDDIKSGLFNFYHMV